MIVKIDASGRARYLVASPEAAPVRMRPSQSASIRARGRPSAASKRHTQNRAPALLWVYALNPIRPFDGNAADIVARTASPATRRRGWFAARPAAHSRKAASSAKSVVSIVSSSLTSVSRRKSGTANLDIAVIDAGLRRRIARARVGHFATSDGNAPSVVPVCFVLLGETLYQAIDGKPKSVNPAQLRRVKNVRSNPNAALLIDQYVEDWRRLWYVLLRGKSRIVDAGAEQRRAIVALRKKYPQYRTTVPLASDALVIAIDVRRLQHLRASSNGRGRPPRPGRPAWTC